MSLGTLGSLLAIRGDPLGGVCGGVGVAGKGPIGGGVGSGGLLLTVPDLMRVRIDGEELDEVELGGGLGVTAGSVKGTTEICGGTGSLRGEGGRRGAAGAESSAASRIAENILST